MSQKVTIGGDRIGSGKKMQAELHDYYRSTHNLSEFFASSMAPGVLYPAMCKLAMRGDSFDIDLKADCRTIPTVGPLFGSFKMQIDVYQCPIRLYQGILHNNPLAIGLNMSQVKFPILHVETNTEALKPNSGKFSDSCLLKYLGMSGIGKAANMQVDQKIGRRINAIPTLAYYDIFKTYYANKQETNAYVINAGEVKEEKYEILKVGYCPTGEKETTFPYAYTPYYEIQPYNEEIISFDENHEWSYVAIDLTNPGNEDTETLLGRISLYEDQGGQMLLSDLYNTNELTIIEHVKYAPTPNKYDGKAYEGLKLRISNTALNSFSQNASYTLSIHSTSYKYDSNIHLQKFPLANIDDMRYDLLGHHELGTAFEIDEKNAYMPYKTLVNINQTTKQTENKFAMNGLVVKTYLNDMFNNWLNTEWIEGENGINELTKVAIVDGAFSMDALNMSMKLYNMLNRIALAGGTYEDWQDVVYEEVQRRQIESPMFIGGMSQEVMFDEIIQTAPTEDNPLGTLGGRGRLVGNQKGGKIHVKCDEACFIIAIVSLTPRLYYTQGNEFYMTDILTMDDLHKPAMDGIGFQDLIGERMAWFDTTLTGSEYVHRSKIGKLPAWIEYMTSVNKAYGDFAQNDGKNFMILSRNYEMTETGEIKDATTYIDPEKYNYAFAVQELAAQNFWVQINFNIKARRLMSARLIPNV